MTRSSSKNGGAKSKRKKPEKLEFVQPFLPVKEIRNGIIETTDGRYIKILEIEPINFMLRSSEEQFNRVISITFPLIYQYCIIAQTLRQEDGLLDGCIRI